MGLEQKQRILVTGSNGFVGKRLVLKLIDSGYNVTGFDLNDGDITNFDFSAFQQDHIIHLASRVFVPDSWIDTAAFYKTNVQGTINILELCRKLNCSLTYISSYVYGTPVYLGVDENHPINPASPYNHSKLMAEEACRYYSKTFGVPITIFRPLNIYGPEQSDQFLIPVILNQILNNQNNHIEVTDLRPKRDYLFIDDFIDAMIKSIHITGFNIFNIGSGKSYSVKEIIEIIIKTTGINKPYKSTGIARTNEIWDVRYDISKITDTLDWYPKTDLETGIKLCIK